MIESNSDYSSSGFQFSNFARNEKLISKGFALPKVQKTGTTIAGMLFKDGVVLGADTRATSGDIVADKESNKIHYMQPNIYCCGAGTAADLDMTTQMVSSQLQLHRLNTGREVPVVAAKNNLSHMLFRYQGNVGCALILGGVDKDGSHIYTIAPHGSYQHGPYDTMGSGSLAAMTVLETRWKPDLEEAEAMSIMRDAVAAGILNDMGSGSTIDLCVITKDGATKYRKYENVEIKGKRDGTYSYPKGTTETLSFVRKPIEIVSEIVRTTTDDDDAMDTA